MTIIERREWTADAVEMRAEGDGMTFSGYAIRFNSPSVPLPFTETIMPGATLRSLRSRNEIKAFVNHDTNMVLGSTRAGTLSLAEDDKGLLAQIQLPDTTYGRDLAVSVKRGDVSGMSFGFSVPKGGDTWSEDGSTRSIHELRVHEVSPVTGFPAYPSTTASVRALAVRCQEDADLLETAVEALLLGEKIGADVAGLLRNVIDKMCADDTADMAEDMADPADMGMTEMDAVTPLSLLMKQMALMQKAH